MIYLVSNQISLYDSDLYEVVSVEESIKILEAEKELGLDTETQGWRKLIIY